MKSLVLTLCFVIAAFGYPDVSELSGYNYNRPSGNDLGSGSQPSSGYNYNRPSGNNLGSTNQGADGYKYNRPSGNDLGSSNQPSGSYLPASDTTDTVQATLPSSSYIPASSSNNVGQTASPSGSYIPPSGLNNFGLTTSPSGSYIPPSGSGNFGQVSPPSGSYLPGGSGGRNSNAMQDQRHVYFYAAPDDEEKQHLRIQVAPSSHKNTKIIFVKTPSYGGVIPEVIAPPSQAEDKTLVYVLVKKPQQVQAINIPASMAVKQAKPEVYFIKYKNQHEAERAVSESLGGHPAGSNLPSLNDAQAFIRALKHSPQNGGGLTSGASLLGSGDFGSNLGGSGLGTTGFSGSYGPPGQSGPY